MTAFVKGQRIAIWDGDTGTVLAGPLPDWNGAYEVAVDGDGINYVAGRAMTLLADGPVSETVGGIRRQQVPPTPVGEVDMEDRGYFHGGTDSGN